MSNIKKRLTRAIAGKRWPTNQLAHRTIRRHQLLRDNCSNNDISLTPNVDYMTAWRLNRGKNVATWVRLAVLGSRCCPTCLCRTRRFMDRWVLPGLPVDSHKKTTINMNYSTQRKWREHINEISIKQRRRQDRQLLISIPAIFDSSVRQTIQPQREADRLHSLHSVRQTWCI